MKEKTGFFIKEFQGFVWMSLLFILWALAYILHSSYVAIDGRRYFTLFDDAMISMRYAWNFAHGSGLVWNRGEYIEGYTNLLMTLLMSVPAFLLEKRYAVLATQLTGIFFNLGTAFFTLKIAQTLRASKNFKVPEYLLFALILLYYPLNFWSLLGMETGLLAFLLSAGVLCSILYAETLQTKFLWWMVLCLGLAYLTRNDSILFAAWIFLHLTQTLKAGRTRLLTFLASGLTFGLFPVGQTLFRLFYYGQTLPNTYTLKLVGMALDERLHNGWGFVSLFLKESWFVLLIAFIGLFIKPSRWKFYLFGFLVIAIAYQVYVGGDPWHYWRMMSPVMPFIFILFISTLEETIPNHRAIINYSFLIPIALAAVIILNQHFLREIALLDLPYNNKAAHEHIDQAIAIDTVTDETATVGVFWAGTLPYYTDRPAIDFLGKSDPYIANLPPDTSGQIAWDGMNSVPGHNKYDLNYSIKQLQPTYVQALEWGGQNLSEWGGEHYVRANYKGVRLYLLKDSPHVDWDKLK